MIDRPEYLNKLLGFKDKQLIKIVSGVRRCGKSTLFELYQAELVRLGVAPEQIQSINLEDPVYRNLSDWEKLYDHINARLLGTKKNYIFIDEIQNVQDFEKAADGLFIKKNVDLYLTGSNSKLQSGAWATLLSGRYVEIHVFPLSFREYASAYPSLPAEELYSRYLEHSSFPYAVTLAESGDGAYAAGAGAANSGGTKQQLYDYLAGIYNTMVLKDVMENRRIREAGRLERVIKFMAGAIGSEISIKRISDMLTSEGVKILPLTVESYLDAFRSSYILYRADRYDVKGKKLLKTLSKYYLVDMGLRRFLLGSKPADSGHILENVVYLELLRRKHKVYVGKAGEKELDFVTEGPEGTEYYQVSETLRGAETLARELAPLNAIRDHNPKFLLTRDYDPPGSHNGIRQLNALDWLLGR
jgi:predicted AAA+ superfamily ATPase